LEAKETLEFDEIRRCLDPDSKVTPLKRPKGGFGQIPPTR